MTSKDSRSFVNPILPSSQNTIGIPSDRMDIVEVDMSQFGQVTIPMTSVITSTKQATIKTTREITTKATDIRPNVSQKSLSKCQLSRKRLPSFLLSNIQSFGNSEEKDKTTELEAMLELNNIDIACITETWLTESSKNRVVFNGYTSFHSVRSNVQRASGGISIFVNEDFRLVKKLNVKIPEHIESLWISVRPNWLPRAISVIIVAGVYYPGSDSIYAPSQEDIILHLTPANFLKLLICLQVGGKIGTFYISYDLSP